MVIVAHLFALAIAAPDEIEVLAESARLLRERGALEESLAVLQRAYDLEPLPVLANNMGRALEELGRYQQAAEMYRRVVEDPAAEPELVRTNRERLRVLEQKLSWSFVQLDPAIEDSAIRAGGAAITTRRLKSGVKELDLRPGEYLFEYLRGGHELVLRVVALRAGTSTLSFERKNDAALRLPTARIRVRKIFIDGRAVHTPLAHVERIVMPAGAHELLLDVEGRGVEKRFVVLTAGHEVALDVEISAPDPKISLRSGFEVAPPESSSPSLAPWITAGAGATLIASGAVLSVLAANDRARVEAFLGSGETINGITFREADALEARANVEATTGAVAIGVGVTAVCVAVAWWMFSE